MCCPHGEALVDDPDYEGEEDQERKICQVQDVPPYEPKIMENFNQGKKIINITKYYTPTFYNFYLRFIEIIQLIGGGMRIIFWWVQGLRIRSTSVIIWRL